MQMEKLQYVADLWAYTVDTSGSDDKRQFWFCVYTDISSFFFCPPSHLSVSPVHLPIVLATVFCFFTGELPPCLLVSPGQASSTVLPLLLFKTLSPFLQGFWPSRDLLFLLWYRLRGSSLGGGESEFSLKQVCIR